MSISSTLLRKELRQLGRARGLVASAAILPIVLLTATVPQLAPAPGAERSFGSALLPLVALAAAITVPSLMAMQSVFTERERRTIDLLVGLPLTLRDVIAAKAVSVLLVAAAAVLPPVVLVSLLAVSSGIETTGYAAGLLALTVGALICSVTSSVAIALAVRDIRVATNLAGFVFLPLVLVAFLIVSLAPPAADFGVGMALAVLGTASLASAVARTTFEGYAD